MKKRETNRDAQRMRLNREEIVEPISRALPMDGWKEMLRAFFFTRSSKPTESLNTVHQPAFCFLAQGSKRAQLAEEVFQYDPDHYMIFTARCCCQACAASGKAGRKQGARTAGCEGNRFPAFGRRSRCAARPLANVG